MDEQGSFRASSGAWPRRHPRLLALFAVLVAGSGMLVVVLVGDDGGDDGTVDLVELSEGDSHDREEPSSSGANEHPTTSDSVTTPDSGEGTAGSHQNPADTTTTTGMADTGAVDATPTELPEPLTGRWEGVINQTSSNSTYDIVVELEAPSSGSDVGTVDYPTLECSGFWRLEDVGKNSVIVTEHITEGTANCVVEGEVTLRYVDDDHISYSYAYMGDPQDGQGTLTRVE